jgi:hypothetical protein
MPISTYVPIITAARNALWSAIDLWPDLKNSANDATCTRFARTYRLDDGDTPIVKELEPSMGDLPALMIAPLTLIPQWYLNQMQNWPTLLQMTIWTPQWALPEPERFVEDLSNAIYQQQAVGTTVAVVKQATGFYPQVVGPVTFLPVKIGKDGTVKAMRTQMQVTMRTNKNPFSPS